MSAAKCLGQCDLLLRETFRFGERPHGGNGRPRVVELEDRLHDYWPQASSIGARWISADQAPQPLWQFSWASVDPAELDPTEPDGNGTAFGEPGAAAMIPFAAPQAAFTMAADVVSVDSDMYLGYTTTTSFVNNFQTDGALWMSMNPSGNWSIRANGNVIVASGQSLGGGALSGGFYRIEMTFNPATSQVWGSAAGEPFGPFGVTLTRPLAYFGMEAHDGWCLVNNLAIYSGAPVQISVSGPTTACVGGSATLTATSNAQSPARYIWTGVAGAPLTDGPLPSGTVLAGTGTSVLSISNIAPADLSTFACTVINDCGLHESAHVVLTACQADFDCSGDIAVSDIFAFLSDWFAGNPRANVDGVNGLQVADIFSFLNAWFAGC